MISAGQKSGDTLGPGVRSGLRRGGGERANCESWGPGARPDRL